MTKTYDPTQPTTASNTPFPNGSLQNWGNAVRLRHPGGLTSWYFHIQPNGVTVKVGDTVQRGQPIANSGNIGRTSGPHLHFQVQADFDQLGPVGTDRFRRLRSAGGRRDGDFRQRQFELPVRRKRPPDTIARSA